MDPAAEHVVVARSRSEPQCAELSLVLTASGIEHWRTSAAHGEWLLVVPAAEARRAVAELEAYRAEHARPVEPPPPVPEHRHPWVGVGAYAALLMLVATFAKQYAFGLEWLAAGRLAAGQLLAGEWWRSVTALTLHVDTGHLASNLGFGAFFGYFIGRYFGPGVGWFAILASGTLGNVLNAVIQSPDHRSIGASTAVFGALGLLTAHAWRRGVAQTSWRARVAPLAAGIGLLAFTGTGGENTDIFAHLTGFAAGFGIGAGLARTRVPQALAAQAAFGAAAVGVVVLAWIWGLAAAG
ncbi:MAG: rhomboid family intramembrane serine protease [Gammaproteobacteria bacterium]|nr:rhomboid family intramembrane serine protease [Gammaproteobacteria bacterium]